MPIGPRHLHLRRLRHFKIVSSRKWSNADDAAYSRIASEKTNHSHRNRIHGCISLKRETLSRRTYPLFRRNREKLDNRKQIGRHFRLGVSGNVIFL